MMLWTIVLGGALVGLGAAVLVGGFLQSQPKLGAALERLGATGQDSAAETAGWEAAVATWVRRRMDWVPGFTVPTKDLRLIGMSQNSFLDRKALLALAGLIAPLLFGIYTELLGVFPLGIPAVLGVPLAALLWMLPDIDVREKTAEARQEFTRAVAVYLELTAAERAAGRPPATALMGAAEVSTAWPFRRIHDALQLARWNQEQPWDALVGLAGEIGVPELAEVGTIVALAGTEGAAVASSLRASARTLRARMLTEEHVQANKASARFRVQLMMLALLFVGVILTPLMLALA